jgi:hypothetical protein
MKAFGGVLRHFVLGGEDLHDDDDSRQVTVLTDDERPFVIYGEADAPEGRAQGERGDAMSVLLEPFTYSYMVNAMWASRWTGASAPFCRPT